MAGQKFFKIINLIKRQSMDYFLFFFLAKYCFGELGPNHVSKFQVRTRNNERSTAILACFERLGRPSLYEYRVMYVGRHQKILIF